MNCHLVGKLLFWVVTQFSKYKLTENMRVLPNEIEFAKFLLSVGDGTLNDTDDCVILPEPCILKSDDNLIDTVFGHLIKQNNFEQMTQCAILAARNVDVNEVNKQITDLLDKNTEHVYTGIDSTDNCNNGELNEVIFPEYLNSLNPPL